MRTPRLSALFILPVILFGADARADENRAMLDSMIGQWAGSGQLTYTKEWTMPFKCEIEGRPANTESTVDLVGKCWSGPIWSRMGAALRYNKKSQSYIGRFRDGTSTFVIDIKGKPADKAIALDLRQGKQQGAMDLAFMSKNRIGLTISVVNPKTKGQRQVVDLTLDRQAIKVGALNNSPGPHAPVRRAVARATQAIPAGDAARLLP